MPENLCMYADGFFSTNSNAQCASVWMCVVVVVVVVVLKMEVLIKNRNQHFPWNMPTAMRRRCVWVNIQILRMCEWNNNNNNKNNSSNNNGIVGQLKMQQLNSNYTITLGSKENWELRAGCWAQPGVCHGSDAVHLFMGAQVCKYACVACCVLCSWYSVNSSRR